jgi:hypothetical protein
MLAVQHIWYLVPLLVSISLVYGGTRHEHPRLILLHAWKSCVWMVSFMATIFAVLFLFDWWVN